MSAERREDSDGVGPWHEEDGVPVAHVRRLVGLRPIRPPAGRHLRPLDVRRDQVLAGPDRVFKTQERGPAELCSVRQEYRLNQRAWSLGVPVARPFGVVWEQATGLEYLVEQRLDGRPWHRIFWEAVVSQDPVWFDQTVRRLWPTYRGLLQRVCWELGLSGDLAFANLFETERGLALTDAFLVGEGHPWWRVANTISVRDWFQRGLLIGVAEQAAACPAAGAPDWSAPEVLWAAGEMLSAVFPGDADDIVAFQHELEQYAKRRPSVS